MPGAVVLEVLGAVFGDHQQRSSHRCVAEQTVTEEAIVLMLLLYAVDVTGKRVQALRNGAVSSIGRCAERIPRVDGGVQGSLPSEW